MLPFDHESVNGIYEVADIGELSNQSSGPSASSPWRSLP